MTNIAPALAGEEFKAVLEHSDNIKTPKISSGVMLVITVCLTLLIDLMIFEVKSCEVELYLHRSGRLADRTSQDLFCRITRK